MVIALKLIFVSKFQNVCEKYLLSNGIYLFIESCKYLNGSFFLTIKFKIIFLIWMWDCILPRFSGFFFSSSSSVTGLNHDKWQQGKISSSSSSSSWYVAFRLRLVRRFLAQCHSVIAVGGFVAAVLLKNLLGENNMIWKCHFLGRAHLTATDIGEI